MFSRWDEPPGVPLKQGGHSQSDTESNFFTPSGKGSCTLAQVVLKYEAYGPWSTAMVFQLVRDAFCELL